MLLCNETGTSVTSYIGRNWVKWDMTFLTLLTSLLVDSFLSFDNLSTISYDFTSYIFAHSEILCRWWISTWHSLDSRSHKLDSQFQQCPKKSLWNDPFDEEERRVTKTPPKTHPNNEWPFVQNGEGIGDVLKTSRRDLCKVVCDTPKPRSLTFAWFISGSRHL